MRGYIRHLAMFVMLVCMRLFITGCAANGVSNNFKVDQPAKIKAENSQPQVKIKMFIN